MGYSMELIVDGTKIKAKEGQTIIEAIYAAGMELPHFCWHPDLSVSGSCRMCLVEVGREQVGKEGNTAVVYNPKLQIACATPAQDGMIINASSEKVLKARKGVMEFLLINHPLDCPICDEAGECKLQEYTLAHSVGESRFHEEKNHKPKRTKWSDKIIYDAERCILCSRCIRFSKEVAKQDVLTFCNRGDAVYVQVEEGKKFDSPYSMNVIDICPVGALTSADFRFRSRVWDMSFANTISPLDSTGSNIRLGLRKNEILRATPIGNPEANGSWITDDTRLGVLKFNKNRVESSAIRSSNEMKDVPMEQAIAEAKNILKKYKANEILFLLSPHATNEANQALFNFAKKTIKSTNISYFESIDESINEDGKLIVKDKAPNSYFVKSLIPNQIKINEVKNSIKLVYILEDNNNDASKILKELPNLEKTIAHCTFINDTYELANLVFAASSIFECVGSLTNNKGLKQSFKPVVRTNENLEISIEKGRMDTFGADNDKWYQIQLRDTLSSEAVLSILLTKY